MLAAYFLVPAIVLFMMGVGRPGWPHINAGLALAFVPNYLILAAPQIAWGILSMAISITRPVLHGAYVGATLALISVAIYLELNAENSGMGWFIYYWPLAPACMCVMAVIAAGIWRRPVGAPS